ncbi:MAG: cyclodeaminase/cyclohydrolase family protein, partial [Paramuribaculum sp.]|nr:cyclodeaminase/cyclohydrolase family protein [Paramuribaculum sp.]
AGVGALAACAAVRGAALNVRINAAGLADKAKAAELAAEAAELDAESRRLEAEVLEIVNANIDRQ